MTMGELLRVEHLSRSFGGIVVAADISLALGAGDRVALIGPNGAGKTTLINLMTGALAPDSGRILIEGDDVTALPDRARVRRGLVRSFQVSRLFNDLTVRDHVGLAILARRRKTGRLFSDPWMMPEVADETQDLLQELGLAIVARRRVAEIAYGQRRMLEIAIALALKPKVLLLDEPAAGVPHGEANLILDIIERLPAGLAVMMIEHDMDLVFRFAQRVIVLSAGRVICEGAPSQIAADPAVRKAYLGSFADGRRSA
jgi:branched-chain amino acid transport system ATP-binding protein